MTPKEVFFLVTVDGDLRVGTTDQQNAALEAMRRLHAQLDLIGHTTWFINEVDFHWAEQHGDHLLALADSGEAIGLHDHLDTHYAETFNDIHALMSKSFQGASTFLEEAGREIPLLAHRNGCFQQSEAAYLAAQTLGYIWLSDVWPQTALHARMVCDGEMPNPWRRLGEEEGGILTDNKMVPLNGTPWRHDPANWLDYTSRQGNFLQVPVTCAPFIAWDRIHTALDAAEEEQVFLVLDTHPYDLQDHTTGEMDPERMESYALNLKQARAELGARFIRIDEVESFWNA
jgi:hypothetical protein